MATFTPQWGFTCLVGRSWHIERLLGFKMRLFEALGEGGMNSTIKTQESFAR